MFGRRFGPGFGSLFDELFDEAEGPGAAVNRPMMLGGAPRVPFGLGLGVFGNARQQVMFNVAPTLVFRSMFVPQPRVRAFAIIPALDDDADLNSNDLGSMDPSARTESVMSALQRWRDASDDSAAWTAEGESGADDGEYGAAEGEGATTMELNRAAAARAKMGRGGHPRPEPEDEGGAARRLLYALASVALIASVLTLTAAALMSVASLATSALQRIQLAWRRDRGLSVDAVDVSEPLMLEHTVGACRSIWKPAGAVVGLTGKRARHVPRSEPPEEGPQSQPVHSVALAQAAAHAVALQSKLKMLGPLGTQLPRPSSSNPAGGALGTAAAAVGGGAGRGEEGGLSGSSASGDARQTRRAT